GSGLWLNPAIVVFLAPIILHAVLRTRVQKPVAGAAALLAEWVLTGRERLGRAALPVAALLAVLLLNITWAVWVADHKVHSEILLAVFPKSVALAILGLAAAAAFHTIRKKTTFIETARRWMVAHAALLAGIVAGALPALLYSVQAAIGARPMDPSLPLGFRSLWHCGDTLNYLLNGVPLLFGADARPFLALIGVGRDTVVRPLGILESACAVAADWAILGCVVAATIILIVSQKSALSRLLSLRPIPSSPILLLLIAFACATGLYVLGGCTLDFTTIRYLVPLWALIPGLLAAVFVNQRFRLAATLIPICLCVAWAVGQFAMHRQLGAPHPLRAVSNELVASNIQVAVAEPLDAHLLSYLTRQRCRTIEFESFWPRLTKYHPLIKASAPMDYLVQTAEVDRTWDWINGGWPGASPPETQRFLWPKLRRFMQDHPDTVLSRTPLPGGYERIRLSRPLPDRTIAATLPRVKSRD
ncbi:MAG TPA: hypothetical protein VNT79_01100, partial [Phycisphaerae bacterium]|nr:hypothetical protein [Phycisphaerae bacterium]